MEPKRFVRMCATVWTAVTTIAIAAPAPADVTSSSSIVTLDASGLLQTVNVNGGFDLDNPFFQDLGTNGRRCVSCHQPDNAWTITPANVQRRFAITRGADPIFRNNDGSNCEGATAETRAEQQAAYSLLLTRGLIRVGLDLPPNPEFHERTGADASLEVNGVISGATEELRTIIPAVARANLSLRTAPGQSSHELAGVLERLLRDAAPAYAQIDYWSHAADPALFDPDSAPLRLARAAFQRATGRPPALVRSGGTIPILAAFAERGIQTIVSGFALPDDRIHAPNESYRLESLELNEKTSYALFEELGQLA